jgi:hypothetical protein
VAVSITKVMNFQVPQSTEFPDQLSKTFQEQLRIMEVRVHWTQAPVVFNKAYGNHFTGSLVSLRHLTVMTPMFNTYLEEIVTTWKLQYASQSKDYSIMKRIHVFYG